MKVYLDANIFIYPAIYGIDSKERACREILDKMVSGKIGAITSSLTIDEIIWKLIRRVGRAETLKLAKSLFELPNLTVVDVTAQDVYNALELMEKYKNLKPRDAIHAAVAINAGVSKIYSDDSDFDEIKELNRVKL